MDKRIKERWIADLRSGKYKQTTATLKDDRGYCCLGVLCFISAPSGINDLDANYPYVEDLIGSERIANTLVAMNDGTAMKRHSFAKIADYIDVNL